MGTFLNQHEQMHSYDSEKRQHKYKYSQTPKKEVQAQQLAQIYTRNIKKQKKHQETLEKFLQKSYTTSQGQGKKEKCRNMPRFEEKPNGYYVEVKSATMRLLRQWTKRLWTTSLVD